MMSSTNSINQVKQLIESHVQSISFQEIDQYQVAVEIEKDHLHLLLSVLKQHGWRQLSYLSAVDWPDEQKFEMVYIVMNWDQALHIQLRTKIDRNEATIPSIITIYPGAMYYERECHEFFGVHFPGNPNHEKQLILENWDDLPPLRKDFDPKAYSDRKFAAREYSETYIVSDPENQKKMKRESRKKRATSLRGNKS